MSTSVSTPGSRLQRRDRFRAYMQAFNPTAPARDAIKAGLVCEDLQRFLFRNLAGRADLEPGSQQLLVGGIGSGKTTELLLAERWLREQGHVLPVYIDISAETDLSSLNSGSLLASFGIRLARLSDHLRASAEKTEVHEKLKQASNKMREYAYGKAERVFVPYDEEPPEPDEQEEDDQLGYYESRIVPGKLKPPLPGFHRDIRGIRAPLEELLTMAREASKDIVLIFDGLDRLLDPTKFWSVSHQDLRLLRELKVSVLATAPLSVLFGAGSVSRSVSDQFDRVHHLPALAAEPGSGLLRSVLEKRQGGQLLGEADADSICWYSGGVLRDLISLARDAAEEAYVSDRDSVTPADVEKVVRQLGTGYVRGLGPEAIKTLFDLEKSKSFRVDEPANVELLVTRRVLEYSSTDFRVHPALLSVIPRLEPKSV